MDTRSNGLNDLRTLELAHDLKVPLQLITSCVQLLEDEFSGSERAEGYLRTLARSAGQLQSMLENALERDELRTGFQDVVADARTLAREFELMAREKNVHVYFTGNCSKFSMRTDVGKLRRILRNLLENSLRFTPSGGKIWLKVQVMGDAVEFSIEDSGCGIPEKNRARIFESGFTTGGSGHGLAICKRFAEQLGGSLDLMPLQGIGSSFVLRLPVPAET